MWFADSVQNDEIRINLYVTLTGKGAFRKFKNAIIYLWVREKWFLFRDKRFKQKVARDGVPSEWKKREAYDKPGVKRRAAKKEGIKNTRKRDRANRNRDN